MVQATTLEAPAISQLTAEDIVLIRQFLHFSKSLKESLNTGAVANLATTLSSLAVLLEDLNRPEIKRILQEFIDNSDDFGDLLKTFVSMQKNGSLKTLFELATFITAITQSMSSDIVPKISRMIPTPVKTGFTLEKMFEATRRAKDQVDKENPNMGIGVLIRTLRDPDIQYVVNFTVLFLKSMVKIAKEDL